MSARTGKFYRKNEKEIMEMIGLTPTVNSGSGWVEKEDGESDYILCQLKSTDAGSIKIDKQDLDTLEYHASVSHKLPVFAIQFLRSNKVYLIVNPDQLCDVAKYIKTGDAPDQMQYIFSAADIGKIIDTSVDCGNTVKSSFEARENYNKAQEKRYKKKWRSAI